MNIKRKFREKYVYFRLAMYNIVMRGAHRYNWHYASPLYLDGDIHIWCKWCGLRHVVKKKLDNKFDDPLNQLK